MSITLFIILKRNVAKSDYETRANLATKTKTLELCLSRLLQSEEFIIKILTLS